MSLNAFLNPVKIENKEVLVSSRFVEDGKVVPFEIRPITQEENEKLMSRFTLTDKKTGVQSFDRSGYIARLTADAVVSPDLKNADLQKAYGTMGEVNTLKKMLYAGEFALLVGEVQELSGFDEDINKDIDEAKN